MKPKKGKAKVKAVATKEAAKEEKKVEEKKEEKKEWRCRWAIFHIRFKAYESMYVECWSCSLSFVFILLVMY